MGNNTKIKIIHTSDWHLGKKLFKQSFLPEQKLFLKWLKDTIEAESIDILVIAGDIFDTPVPPNEAQKLYFDFLKEITSPARCSILIISGNHDSGHFLEAPLPFLQDHNIKIWGRVSNNPKDHVFNFKKEDCEISFFALPYFRSYEILKISTDSNNSSSENLITSLRDFITKGIANQPGKLFFIGHHLFGNYELTGSEQALSLSGIDSIGLDLLSEQFDFSFLGHIHKKQTLNKVPLIEYSGAPIPFRFSETGTKQISIYTLQGDKFLKESKNIPMFRKLYKINCSVETLDIELKKLIEESQAQGLKAFLDLTVSIDRPISGISDQARTLLNGSNIELLSFQYQLKESSKQNHHVKIDLNAIGPEELFKLFYKNKFPDRPEVAKEIMHDFRFFYNEKCNDEELLQ